MVKSAERALAMLEFLKQSPPATVGDVCSALGYPNSSASVLMRSLATAGYLDYDSDTRRYKPSYRVALLGESISTVPLLGDDLKQRLHDIHQQTGQSVLVGMQNGAYVQYVHVLAKSQSLLARLPIGKMRLMAYNPMGEALLALMDDKRIQPLLRHNNANWPDADSRMTEAAEWENIRATRARGYAEGPGRTWPDATIIAIALKPRSDMPSLAVAVGGLSRSIVKQREMILEELQAFSRLRDRSARFDRPEQT